MSNFNANGQKVFVEPEWITGETCLFGLKNKVSFSEYSLVKRRLTELRKELLKKLESEGYIITTDKYDTEDVVSFIMNDTAILENLNNQDYKTEFDRRMFNAGGGTLHYPHSVHMEEFFENPFFPVVLKNEVMNAGIDKFLIENTEQLEIIKKLYQDKVNNKGYKEMFDACIFQQYIENPKGYKSYIRVLMSTSGEVMGASLKYTKASNISKTPSSPLEKILLTKDSPYYIGCQTMFNYYADGGSISFFQPRYSTLTQNVLTAHNIDPIHPEIPQEILTTCQNIMEKCNSELGILVGFDFIYNVLDNTWYYLENQAFPAIDEWVVKKGGKALKTNSISDVIKMLALEATCRYEALHSYTLKKQSEQITLKKQP